MTIEELEAALAAARSKQREEAEAAKAAVPPILEYRVEPVERSYDRIYDPACRVYRVFGRCVNAEEAKAAGHSSDLNEGGYNYVYNTATGRVVCGTGGGRVYLGFDHDTSPAHLTAIDRLGAFLAEHPEGGPVDDIVEAYDHEKEAG
jgi:hypothetical protein